MRKTKSTESLFISDRSFCVESDTGCVLRLASLLEERLRQIHEAHIETIMYPSKTKIFKDLNNPHAPLSSFAGKIQLAFAYGLITEGDYRDLDIIREIRNEAAHTLHDFSLHDPGLLNLVKRLRASTRYGHAKADLSGDPGSVGTDETFPEFTEGRCLLLLNGLVLDDALRRKLCEGLQALLTKRKATKTEHAPQA